jgi:hypothetical protein
VKKKVDCTVQLVLFIGEKKQYDEPSTNLNIQQTVLPPEHPDILSNI